MTTKPFVNGCLATVEIASGVVMVYALWRTLAGPMSTRTLAMRVARSGEAYAMRQASRWANVADGCHRTYDAVRSVSV